MVFNYLKFGVHDIIILFQFAEVVSICTIFPVITNEREDNADIGTLMGNDEVSKGFRKQLMTNERVIKTVKCFLPLWDAKGLLDPL